MSNNRDQRPTAPCSETLAGPVPSDQRRGPVTMSLLWVTMVTGFPTVLAGFEWYKQGMTVSQVFTGVIVSALILLVYSVPACYLGARTGMSYTTLSRDAFGKRGSWLVSFNIIVSSIAWYALTACFLAEGLKALYHLDIPSFWLAAGLAVLMAFNNFFGFSGVANFARYAAGPVLIAWMLYCFGKAAGDITPELWNAPAQMSSWQAMTMVSSFVIGFAVWGNEADYWRFAKPTIGRTVIPLAVSITLGQVIFPIAGWLVAYITKTADPSTATAVMNSYAFGGASLLAAVVLIMTYVAVNDSLLFATVNALENVYTIPRRTRVIALAVTGALLAAVLSQHARSFETIAALSSIILPAATTITLVEGYFPAGSSGCASTRIGWPAILSLLIGCALGVYTSDLLPGAEAVGVPSLQAWLTSMVSYAVLRKFQPNNQQDN